MKPDLDKKFDSLRNTPTELSRQQVESMIKGLPVLPATPIDKSNWMNWFSLNNILVAAVIGGLTIGGVLFFNASKGTDALVEKETPVNETISEAAVEEVPTVVDADLENSNANTNGPFDSAQDKKEEKLFAQVTEMVKAKKPQKTKTKTKTKNVEPELVVSQKVQPTHVIESVVKKETPEVEPEVKNETLVVKNDPPEPLIYREPTSVASVPMTNDPKKIPDLTNGEMRRLRRALFKNLLSDKLIINKWKIVKIELPGDEIIVNGEVVDQSFFNKYSELTKNVGYGPDRQIQFDEEYIKVGDFTATGFVGSGFGTFRNVPGKQKKLESNSREELLATKRREIKKEQRELDAFSQTLLDTANGRRGRKNLFSVNLKKGKCEKLQKELYEELLEDGLIESKTDYVLIEISKKEIFINVLQLNETLYEKYSELFEIYEIKPGARRQIRMSEHTFRVGDFSRGSFTGTSVTF